jgi:hypothetical protein
VSRATTIKELQDWELGGAQWRIVFVTGERAVVDLCTCTGEVMERVESEEPEVIEFVRSHPAD